MRVRGVSDPGLCSVWAFEADAAREGRLLTYQSDGHWTDEEIRQYEATHLIGTNNPKDDIAIGEIMAPGKAGIKRRTVNVPAETEVGQQAKKKLKSQRPISNLALPTGIEPVFQP
jgi:hypothetical protein